MRDQQLIHIRTEGGCRPAVRLARFGYTRPLRMLIHRRIIQDARIVHEQGHAPFGSHLSPDLERVPDKSRRGMTHLGGITRNARVPFAVDLQIIRVHLVHNGLNHGAGGVFAHLGAIQSRMKIKMNPEKTIRTL